MDLNTGAPAGSLPSTPRKQQVVREQFDAVFMRLSAMYSLDFTLPDPTKSPTKRKRSGDRVEYIYWRLNYQNNQGDLHKVLDTFREKAIRLSSKWVHEPRSVDPVSGVPAATTPHERDDLVKLLQDVLHEFRPKGPPTALSANLSRSLLREPVLLNPTRLVAKRPSHAPHQPPSKRTKSTSPDTDAASQGIFVTGPATHSATTKPPRAPSMLSMHSSRASCVVDDSTFSHAVDRPSPTQTTIEASSQEQKRLPSRAISSQDSYDPSPTSLLALNESIMESRNQELPLYPENDYDSSDSEASSFPASAIDPLMKKVSQSTAEPTKSPTEVLEESLDSVWLHTPRGLSRAPLVITWEVLRICSALGLDLRDMSFTYSEEWLNQDTFWRALANHDQLRTHCLPQACHPAAWAAAVGARSGSQVLTLTASLVFSPKRWPLFKLRLKPPRLDLPHRLDRRFGSDRFLELIIPALDSIKNPSSMKAPEAAASLVVKEWLIKKSHKFLDRTWAAFFVRPIRDKPSKVARSSYADTFETPLEAPGQDRLYLFAQDGNGFGPGSHVKMDRAELAEWLLQVSKNQKQPIMKLCSRFSLGLSRTQPTIVLEKDAIKIMKMDKLSESGKVMNDGIGRVSVSLAKKIRDHLGLAEVPTGFQGRIGSGKGFWIRDIKDKRPGDWIEIYPSQRKWKCDFADPEHRTIEVCNMVLPLKPASLNTQFLDILEDRAKDKMKMRKSIGGLLRQSLKKAIEEQKTAMENPLSLRLWAQQNAGSSHREGLVPYVGGLPKRSEDQMDVLLDSGFDPKRLHFLSELSLKFRREKCEETKKRMNIHIGCSTHAFMVVDFLGILEENEVHLGFSSSFKDEQTGFCDTYLHGMDVLVARSPAHFPSDIQRVKAVFKTEFGSLKDVIIFPIKGRDALADTLSGGDYDGDIAWVCWNQDIVTNFENAAVPQGPDLFKEGFLSKQTETYQDLIRRYGGDQASSKFFEQSLLFNMKPKFLGMCTNFKEKLCYQQGSVGSDAAIRLSTLLSSLVDQSKQGIEFSHDDWTRFYKSLLGGLPIPSQPGYKSHSYAGGKDFKHIIDYLKFGVLLPNIDRELARLHKVDDGTEPPAQWDPDLAKLASQWGEIKVRRPKMARVLEKLDTDLDGLYRRWLEVSTDTFEDKVAALHSMFRSIQPSKSAGAAGEFIQVDLKDNYSLWSLIKASVLFKRFYKKGVFVWWIAGQQLCMLKSRCVQNNEVRIRANNDRVSVLVCPGMYAPRRVDAKCIRSMTLETGGRVGQEPRDVDSDENLE